MEEVQEEYDEPPEEVEIPPQPVLEREPKKDLKDRVQCPQCSKWISEHCFRYSHKCKARAPEPVEPKRAVRIRAPEKEKKPEPAEKKAMKRVPSRQPESQELSPILNFRPPQVTPHEAWLRQRATMSARTASMMAPYHAMFASMR